MTNREIADRLDAFATLLELADANPYTARAYRRASDTIRSTPAAVSDLVRSGRVRELRGIGSGIESRLRELVETGSIAELAELERELSPELVGLGRYLGLTAQRSLEIARALDIRTAEEFRSAAAEGRLRSVPGVGPKLETRLLDALAHESDGQLRPSLLLNRARELTGAIAAALDVAPAGDARRWCDACERLAVVGAAAEPEPILARFAELPQIVAVLDRANRRATGVTVEGVPIELIVAEPDRFGTELVRATGSDAYVAALEPLPAAPDEPAVYRALGLEWCPPELREEPGAPRRRSSSSSGTSAAISTATRPGLMGGRASRRWVAPPPRAATSTWRSATTRRRWGRCAAHAGRGSPPGRGDRRGERTAGAVPRAARHRVRHPARWPSRPRR